MFRIVELTETMHQKGNSLFVLMKTSITTILYICINIVSY